MRPSFPLALTGLALSAVAAPAGIEDRTFSSKLNGRDVTIKVYTPPGYESGTGRYPVVYNLHGAGGGSPDRQWDRVRKTLTGAMEGKKVRPMIYVFVNGLGDTFFIDYADGSFKIESMIVKELIPWVDRNYRTIAAKQGRAVDGFSMGGFGCLMLAFRHPELFSSVVSYGAALIDPGQERRGEKKSGDAPPKKNPHAGRWGDRAHVDQYNPRALAQTHADAIRRGLRVRVVCGDQDGLYARNVTFKKLLDELKIPVDWVPVPGVAHDTGGLYRRVGVESLKFIETGFDAAAKQKDAAPIRQRIDPVGRLPRLKVADNGRFLVTEDGTPFFWLGDTSWAAIEKGRREDADNQPSILRYFRDRAAKRFNVLQVRLVSKAGRGADAYGHRPFVDDDYARPLLAAGPVDDYWDWVDWFIDRAAEHGIYLAVLPCWLSGLPLDHPMSKHPEIGHMARANPQWREAAGQTTAMIQVMLLVED